MFIFFFTNFTLQKYLNDFPFSLCLILKGGLSHLEAKIYKNTKKNPYMLE